MTVLGNRLLIGVVSDRRMLHSQALDRLGDGPE